MSFALLNILVYGCKLPKRYCALDGLFVSLQGVLTKVRIQLMHYEPWFNAKKASHYLLAFIKK
jgi:hypothetical protein